MERSYLRGDPREPVEGSGGEQSAAASEENEEEQGIEKFRKESLNSDACPSEASRMR